MDYSQPEWAMSDGGKACQNEESKPLGGGATEDSGESSFAPSPMATETMSDSSSQISSERTCVHKVYRCFKFITIAFSLLLFLAQVVSIVYLPFDSVELALKVFLSSFALMIILNELERSKMLQASPVMWQWIPRGYFYTFVGLVSVEENNVAPSQTINTLPVDYTAAIFIETASWMMVATGCCYVVFGLCCGQRYLAKVRDDYKDRLEERKRIFEVGLQSDAAFSAQMIT